MTEEVKDFVVVIGLPALLLLFAALMVLTK